MQGESSNVVVAVRIKPIDPQELADGARFCLRVDHKKKSIVVYGTYADERSFTFDYCFSSSGEPGSENYASQSDIYEALGKRLLQHAWNGFNCSVFAYGQTGSGKTYTMMGEDKCGVSDVIFESGSSSLRGDFDGAATGAGLIPRFCRSLFSQIIKAEESVGQGMVSAAIVNSSGYSSSSSATKTPLHGAPLTGVADPAANGREVLEVRHSVDVTYVEIYNERVFDLLTEGRKARQHSRLSLYGRAASSTGTASDGVALRVREHPKHGPYVEGAVAETVINWSGMAEILRRGAEGRTVASTRMNVESSRSHAIFTINFTQTTIQRPVNDPNGDVVAFDRTSRVSLVDLAGSERSSKTGATGERLRESTKINQSLLTLGTVINALSEFDYTKDGESGNRLAHVPYRNSVLTWLLKETLGGNSRTIMLATVSPSERHYEETSSTLRYAERAKRIKTRAVVNEDPNVALIRQLRAEIEELRLMLGTDAEVQMTALKQEVASLRIQNFVRGKFVQQAAQVQQRLLQKLQMSVVNGEQLNVQDIAELSAATEVVSKSVARKQKAAKIASNSRHVLSSSNLSPNNLLLDQDASSLPPVLELAAKRAASSQEGRRTIEIPTTGHRSSIHKTLDDSIPGNVSSWMDQLASEALAQHQLDYADVAEMDHRSSLQDIGKRQLPPGEDGEMSAMEQREAWWENMCKDEPSKGTDNNSFLQLLNENCSENATRVPLEIGHNYFNSFGMPVQTKMSEESICCCIEHNNGRFWIAMLTTMGKKSHRADDYSDVSCLCRVNGVSLARLIREQGRQKVEVWSGSRVCFLGQETVNSLKSDDLCASTTAYRLICPRQELIMAFQLSFPEVQGIGAFLSAEHETHSIVYSVLSQSSQACKDIFWQAAMNEIKTKRPITESEAIAIASAANSKIQITKKGQSIGASKSSGSEQYVTQLSSSTVQGSSKGGKTKLISKKVLPPPVESPPANLLAAAATKANVTAATTDTIVTTRTLSSPSAAVARKAVMKRRVREIEKASTRKLLNDSLPKSALEKVSILEESKPTNVNGDLSPAKQCNADDTSAIRDPTGSIRDATLHVLSNPVTPSNNHHDGASTISSIHTNLSTLGELGYLQTTKINWAIANELGSKHRDLEKYLTNEAARDLTAPEAANKLCLKALSVLPLVVEANSLASTLGRPVVYSVDVHLDDDREDTKYNLSPKKPSRESVDQNDSYASANIPLNAALHTTLVGGIRALNTWANALAEVATVVSANFGGSVHITRDPRDWMAHLPPLVRHSYMRHRVVISAISTSSGGREVWSISTFSAKLKKLRQAYWQAIDNGMKSAMIKLNGQLGVPIHASDPFWVAPDPHLIGMGACYLSGLIQNNFGEMDSDSWEGVNAATSTDKYTTCMTSRVALLSDTGKHIGEVKLGMCLVADDQESGLQYGRPVTLNIFIDFIEGTADEMRWLLMADGDSKSTEDMSDAETCGFSLRYTLHREDYTCIVPLPPIGTHLKVVKIASSVESNERVKSGIEGSAPVVTPAERRAARRQEKWQRQRVRLDIKHAGEFFISDLDVPLLVYFMNNSLGLEVWRRPAKADERRWREVIGKRRQETDEVIAKNGKNIEIKAPVDRFTAISMVKLLGGNTFKSIFENQEINNRTAIAEIFDDHRTEKIRTEVSILFCVDILEGFLPSTAPPQIDAHNEQYAGPQGHHKDSHVFLPVALKIGSKSFDQPSVDIQHHIDSFQVNSDSSIVGASTEAIYYVDADNSMQRRLQLVLDQVDSTRLRIESLAGIEISAFRSTNLESLINQRSLSSSSKMKFCRVLSVRRIVARRSLVVVCSLPHDTALGLVCSKGERFVARLRVTIHLNAYAEAVVLERDLFIKTMPPNHENTVLANLKRAVASSCQLPRPFLTGVWFLIRPQTADQIRETLHGFAGWHQHKAHKLLESWIEAKQGQVYLASTNQAYEYKEQDIAGHLATSKVMKISSESCASAAAAVASFRFEVEGRFAQEKLSSENISTSAKSQASTLESTSSILLTQEVVVDSYTYRNMQAHRSGWLVLARRSSAGFGGLSKHQKIWDRRWCKLCRPFLMIYRTKPSPTKRDTTDGTLSSLSHPSVDNGGYSNTQRPMEVINLSECRALVRRDEHEMLFESLNGVAGGSNNIISGSVATTGSSSGSSSPSVWLLQASNEYDLDQWIDAIEPSSWKEVLPSTSTQDASSRMHEENESARQKKSALF